MTLNVGVLPGDNGGCGTYRMTAVADAVRKVRPDWNIRTYQPRGEVRVGVDRHQRVVTIENLGMVPDVLIMQRTGTPVLVGVAEFLQSQGVAIVVDFDDAMWCIDKSNIAYAAWNNPSKHKGQHWSLCDRVAGMADMVTVTTPALADRYGKHGRVEVLPNRIPDKWMTAQPEPSTPPTGGWAGYTATHPGDCQVSSPAAWVFHQNTGLRVMADPGGAAKEWGLPADAVEGLPSTSLGPDYFHGLSQLGVMLVGLQPTPFNRAKSTLKVLEAGAAGVPSIASATAPHRQLQKAGFPVRLASTAAEWERHALDLLNPDTYQDARASLARVMPGYVMSAQAERWAHTWERAVMRRRKFN